MPDKFRRTLSPEYLRQRLVYDKSSGSFVWKAKEVTNIQHIWWNAKFAGSVAGTTCGQGYTIIAIDNVQYRAHRLAWLYVHGSMPNEHIDHRDGDRSNNRIGNLRIATHAENLWNARVRKDCVSGVKGVFQEKNGKWRAEIAFNKRRKYLGRFPTKEQAGAAYAEAARKYHGEFANTGDSDA